MAPHCRPAQTDTRTTIWRRPFSSITTKTAAPIEEEDDDYKSSARNRQRTRKSQPSSFARLKPSIKQVERIQSNTSSSQHSKVKNASRRVICVEGNRLIGLDPIKCIDLIFDFVFVFPAGKSQGDLPQAEETRIERKREKERERRRRFKSVVKLLIKSN